MRPVQSRRLFLTLPLLAAGFAAQPRAATFFPAAATWQRKAPAEVGMDAAKLQSAVAWAQAHGSKWDFERNQMRAFGKILGSR